jgi:D-3-phosphoglycerate dehydrogenase
MRLVVLRAKSILKYKKNTKIKFIISPTTGLNHIDKKFFNNKKIKIISLEGESNFLNKVNATVEFTIYLILFFLRHKQLNQIKKKRISLLGNEINNRKIGIIGIGRIGKKIKKILKTFGAKVLTYEIKKDKPNSLNKLLKESDIISLHIPLRNNYNFLNQYKLKLLKQNSVIINTSRGEIVDEIHLKKYIRSKNITYFTDVISNEDNFFKKSTHEIKIKFFLYSSYWWINRRVG